MAWSSWVQIKIPALAGSTAVEVKAGDFHTCAMLRKPDKNLGVFCWGYNNNGQLGISGVVTVGTSSSEMGDNLQEVNLGEGKCFQKSKCPNLNSISTLILRSE